MDIKSSNSVAKRQKIEESTSTSKQGSSQTSCIELVLFNSDSLFKIASYLTATDLLNLALTCKRFSVSESNKSLIEETARRIVQDIAIVTGEERLKFEATNTVKTRSQRKNEMDRERWLASYHYLQSGVIFDQMHANFEYVGNKSRIRSRRSSGSGWNTAFSNNVMKTGRHYVLFDTSANRGFLAGVMRPGTLRSRTSVNNPIQLSFFRDHYSQSKESLVYNTNNSIHSCMYYDRDGACYSCHWREDTVDNSTRDITWRECFSNSEGKLGLLLDLDEGTLSVYKNGKSLGVMKRGLVGHYCWALSILGRSLVTIKREKIPESLG